MVWEGILIYKPAGMGNIDLVVGIGWPEAPDGLSRIIYLRL